MTKLEEFEKNIKGKKVSVIGVGISNRPLIKYLVALGANVIAHDKRGKDSLDTSDLPNIKFCLGEDYLDGIDGEIIFKTPGLRYDVPQLIEARQRGAVVTSEMEIFFEVCPAPIIAVTGSDGKTTTTTLINKILTEQGYKTWLGGNIGTPLLDRAGEIKPDDRVVLELSSFQLHTMRRSPHIAVITNISPNHLDMHKDYKEYIDAKKNIMLYQNSDDILIVNADNDVTNEIGSQARGRVKYFSRRKKADIWLDGNMIMRGSYGVLDINDIKIPGMHNVENYMAAIAATEGLADDSAVKKVAVSFGGVEHRIELVRTLDGVKYYNSSIDSSPNRTSNTLNVFPEKVILISGGKDKGIPYDDVGLPIVEHAKVLILIGATAGKIEEAVRAVKDAELPEIIHVSSYEDAVNTARQKAKSGDVVLLSPASTSFDMFRNFEERGKLFKKLVNEL